MSWPRWRSPSSLRSTRDPFSGSRPARRVARRRTAHAFKFFALFSDPRYTHLELVALFVVLGIAIAGLLYALMLVKQVKAADQGTPRMQEIAAAVREGANAYLAAQFRKIGPLIVVITVVLYFTKQSDLGAFAFGRAGAFLVGALFSWPVGFVGMRLATTGNLRVAAAARAATARPCSSATAPARSPAC